jgi:hypothetical protein
MAEDVIWKIAQAIPLEWYNADREVFNELVSALIARRKRVRSLIEEFGCSLRKPFPSWLSAA